MMYVDCPCGQELKAADHAAGTLRTCPACGEKIRFPTTPDEARRTPATNAAPPKFAPQAGAQSLLIQRTAGSVETGGHKDDPDILSSLAASVAPPPLPPHADANPALPPDRAALVERMGDQELPNAPRLSAEQKTLIRNAFEENKDGRALEEPQNPPPIQKPGISIPAGLVGLILVAPWFAFRGVFPFVCFLVGTFVCLIGLFEKSSTSQALGLLGLGIAAILWFQFFAVLYR